MKSTVIWRTSLILCLLTLGCEDASRSSVEPPVPTAKSLEMAAAKSALPADSTATVEKNFSGAIFQVPAAWEEVPRKSDVIIAEFKVNGAAGPGRLTLSTAKGSVEDNTSRWKGQFQRLGNDPDPRESKLSVDGKDATLVELFGSFSDMLSQSGPQPGSAMLGVVIPLRETNYFVKLTGPRETITEVRDAFIKFVESADFRE